jgi:hypothetical protein
MSEEGVTAGGRAARVDRAWAIEKLIGSGRYPVGVTDLINDAQALVDFIQEGKSPGKFGGIASPSLASVDETFRAARPVTNAMVNRAKAKLDELTTGNVRVEVVRAALEAALTEPTP